MTRINRPLPIILIISLFETLPTLVYPLSRPYKILDKSKTGCFIN